MHFFGIPIIRSMALGRLLVETQKVASKFLHTRFTHKEKILTRIFIGITSYSRTPSTIAAFPLPRFFCRTIEGNTVTMHSSGENSRKRKDNSDKRGEYRKFDEFSSQIRDLLIKSYARKVIAHVASDSLGSESWCIIWDQLLAAHNPPPPPHDAS